MAHSAGSGDTLARGAIRAVYTVRDEKTISQSAWDSMFDDFDPKAFLKNDKPKVTGKKEVNRRG